MPTGYILLPSGGKLLAQSGAKLLVQSSTPGPPMPNPQLSVYYPTAALTTLYFVVVGPDGRVWNGTAFEALASVNWPSYAIAAADTAGVGIYLGVMPAAIPAGFVSVYGYRKRAGTPAPADTLIGTDLGVYWDGTAFSSGGTTAVAAGPLSRGVVASTSNTLILDAGSGLDVVGAIVYLLDGPGRDQSREVTAVDPATKAATLDVNWTVVPTAPCHYQLLPTLADPLAKVGAVVPGETGYATLLRMRNTLYGTSNKLGLQITWNNPDGTPSVTVIQDNLGDRTSSVTH